jgi:hypothetical protein
VKRAVTVVGVVAASCALVAASAQASARHGRIRGIVFAHGQSGLFGGGGNLSYHGGPVMPTSQVYAIFWIPPGYSVDSTQPGYQQTIENYFTNVAHDSASGAGPFSSNVYWSDTQYYQSTPSGNQNVAYNSTFAGAITDTDPYPSSGCTDSYTSVCLTDPQIQQEIQKVIGSSYPTGGSAEYFLFTPKNVGSCIDNTSSQCSYSYYCAYHSNIGSGPGAILYANMPYANFVPSACGSGQKPNGNDADSTINVTSHEHNETITDPFGSAWYDIRRNEDGDKCAWNFGSKRQLLGPSGAKYNQTINGAHYYLQQEWSNQSTGCVLAGL